MPDNENPSIADLAAQIGSELFSENGEGAGSDSSLEDTSSAQARVANQPPLPNPSSQQSQPQAPSYTGKALPKAWKKEMEPHWQKLDPALHDYIYAREEDVMKGINQYQAGYKSWNDTISPFQQVLQEYPGLNPVQLIQSLIQNHIALVKGTPQQRLEMVKNLHKHYGIDFNPAPPADPNDPLASRLSTYDQRLEALQAQNQALSQALQGFQNSQHETALQAKTREVSEFFSDPKNEFAQDLEADILNLLQKGAVSTLPEAYEMAQWTNPVVRAKLIARQQQQQQTPQKPKPTNLSDTGEAPPRRTKKGSWEDGVDAIVSNHFPSH